MSIIAWVLSLLSLSDNNIIPYSVISNSGSWGLLTLSSPNILYENLYKAFNWKVGFSKMSYLSRWLPPRSPRDSTSNTTELGSAKMAVAQPRDRHCRREPDVQSLSSGSRGDLETTKRSLQAGSLHLDKIDQSASVDGRLVKFTPTEFRLLWVLVQHKGNVLKKAFLYQTVLNKTPGRYDRSIDVHLSRVRKKLRAAGWQGERLRTVHGEGYSCLE